MTGRAIVIRHRFAILLVVAFACGDPASALADGALKFFTVEHNFGAIEGLGMRAHDFSFLNTADKAVRILSVLPSCGCTAAKPEKTEYQPGEKGTVHTEFNPAGQSGLFRTAIVVNDDAGGKYILTLAADIKTLDPATLKINFPAPVISVTPQKVDLGAIKVGDTVVFKVIVGNTGDGDLYLVGEDTPNEQGIRLSGKAIKKGKRIELTLFFQPVKAGKIIDAVAIRSNDPKNPEVKIRVTGKALKAPKAKKAPNRDNHE